MSTLDESLWSDVIADQHTTLYPPASPGAIAAFEAAHGFAMPESHRDFLLRSNGGAVGSARIFGVGRSDGLDLAQQVSMMRPEMETMADGPVMPFASDWGGSYFCYDLQKPNVTGEHPVLYWDHEYSEEPEFWPMVWSEFAPDFASFLRKALG